jgi:hypothetical protein
MTEEYLGYVPRNWPAALQKAVGDPFVYAMELRSIGVVTFEYAEIMCHQHAGNAYSGVVTVANPDWVRLKNIKLYNELCGFDPMNPKAADSDLFTFERGIEVRVSDILWVADAPWGS